MAFSSFQLKQKSVDFIRGVAVFAMIFTHVSAFFGDLDIPWVGYLNRRGADVSFTTFLFVFGFLIAFRYFTEKFNQTIFFRKMLSRVPQILVGYLLTAVFFVFTNFTQDKLWKVVTFTQLVPFAEYLLAFILMMLIIGSLGFLFNWLYKKHWSFALVVALTLYISTALVRANYQLETAPYVGAYLPLFFGVSGASYFAVFQYFSVVMGGMLFGKVYQNKEFASLKNSLIYFLGSAIIMQSIFEIGSLFVGGRNLLHTNFWFSMERFPPAPGFLFMGLTFVFGTLAIYAVYRRYEYFQKGFSKKFVDVISFAGEHVFDFVIIHTLILYLLALVLDTVADQFALSLLYGTVLAICFVVVFWFNYLRLQFSPQKNA